VGYEIVIADPAKNITVFVLNAVADRSAAARSLLANPGLGAEQVGFVLPPGGASPFWRLEMMGGEFCGNAARSFGLLTARFRGLSGKHTVSIEAGGVKGPLEVQVDTRQGRAEVRIPRPLRRETLAFEGKALPVYVFEGITQVIAPDLPPERGLFERIRGRVEETPPLPEALGVMFYHSGAGLMKPAVYVYGTASLVFESSCGSGSAALGAWRSEGLGDGEARYAVTQPGGVIEVRVLKDRGEITDLFIGGPVSLSGRIYIE
jgi:diaminopimelate epimerase